MKDGRVGILLSDLIHLPFSCASNSGNVRQVSRPETPKKKIFHIEAKVPQKFLCTHWKACSKRGSMEKSAMGCKLPNILKFRHKKRTSLQNTGLHPDIWKGMNLKFFMHSIFLFFAAVFAIWSDLELCLPALPPEYLDHHEDQPLYDQEGEGWKC